MKIRTKILSSLAIASVIALAAPLGANAWTTSHNVTGQLNSGGHLVMYQTSRWHTAGTAGLNITDNVDGAYSAFGLRNPVSDVQVTNSKHWSLNETGMKYFALASTGSTSIPAQYFAVNGRMNLFGGGYYNINWAGILYL